MEQEWAKRSDQSAECFYTVSQKRDLYTFAHNFGRCWRIFEIFPLLNSSRNLQQTDCHIAHHTLDVLLHYLVKWQLSWLTVYMTTTCVCRSGAYSVVIMLVIITLVCRQYTESLQEIWANARETCDSISLILYAGCLGLSPVISAKKSV